MIQLSWPFSANLKIPVRKNRPWQIFHIITHSRKDSPNAEKILNAICRSTTLSVGITLPKLRPTLRRQSSIAIAISSGFLPEASRVLVNIAEGEPEQQLRVAAIRASARQEDEMYGPNSSKKWSPLRPRFARQLLRGRCMPRANFVPVWIVRIGFHQAHRARPGPKRTAAETWRRQNPGAGRRILGSATPEDRKKALEEYQSVLTMAGDAKRGQVSFAKNCATCHKIGETGVNVAPDISDSRTKTPAQILADIIHPNGRLTRIMSPTICSWRMGRRLRGFSRRRRALPSR